MNVTKDIFTIGHSTHSLEAFLKLLFQHRIDLVVDVRSVPHSRWQQQYNREILELSLKSHKLAYVFMGDELGGRSDDSDCYLGGRVQYHLMAQKTAFASGIERIIHEAGHCLIALMCAEKDPLECHRTFLVGTALTKRGLSVYHILADGSIETQDDAMSRLLAVQGLPTATLFESRDELVNIACKRQEAAIAYKNGTKGYVSP